MVARPSLVASRAVAGPTPGRLSIAPSSNRGRGSERSGVPSSDSRVCGAPVAKARGGTAAVSPPAISHQ